MIVVDNGHDAGYTTFFPGMLAGGRTFRAQEIKSAKRFSPTLTVFHLTMIGIGIAMRDDEKAITEWSLLLLMYVCLRIIFRKRVHINVKAEKVTYSVAPLSVWLDHFSICALLIIGALLTHKEFLPPYDISDIIAVFLATFLALYLVVPIWSYTVYRQRLERGEING